MAIWTGLLTLLGCSATSKKPQPERGNLTSGPFTIYWIVEYSASTAWYNHGTKSGGYNATSYFALEHQGKPIVAPDDPAPTKPSSYWQVKFLKDAPRPAVLAGTLRMYLITDEQGQPKVETLSQQTHNFSRYQWLDSNKGQPGTVHLNYQMDDSKSSRFLSGGRYLLVNGKTVLDVQTLTIHRFETKPETLDDYGTSDTDMKVGALGFSPKKTQLVLMGYRMNYQKDQQEYALIVVDFARNRAYTVPFDQTNTRYDNSEDATPNWLSTYFDWTTDKSGQEKLVPHKFKRLPYWQGKFRMNDGKTVIRSYELYPVLPEMESQFVSWLRSNYQVTAGDPPYPGSDVPSFAIQGSTLRLYAGQQSGEAYHHVSFSTVVDKDADLLRTIGEAFNQELAQGKYQDLFGRYNTKEFKQKNRDAENGLE